LTPEGFTGTNISPDGRSLLVRGSDGIYCYPMEGGELRRLPDLASGEGVDPWTSDGKAIYVMRSAMGQGLNVQRMSLATGVRTPWFTSHLPDPTCAWIHVVRLTPDGHAYAYGYANRSDALFLGEGLE
jgi:hypothetical protein